MFLSLQFARDPLGEWSRDNDLAVCDDGGAICLCGRHTDVKRNDHQLSHFNVRKKTNVRKTCQLGEWSFGHARNHSNSCLCR